MTSNGVKVEFTGAPEDPPHSNGTADGEAVPAIEKPNPSVRSRHAVLPGKGHCTSPIWSVLSV